MTLIASNDFFLFKMNSASLAHFWYGAQCSITVFYNSKVKKKQSLFIMDFISTLPINCKQSHKAIIDCLIF